MRELVVFGHKVNVGKGIERQGRGGRQDFHGHLVIDLGTGKILGPHFFVKRAFFDGLRWAMTGGLFP